MWIESYLCDLAYVLTLDTEIQLKNLIFKPVSKTFSQ